MTREESDDAKQARQEYDDNIRAESADVIHTLQERLSACEESLATCQAYLAQSEKEDAELFDDNHELMVELKTVCDEIRAMSNHGTIFSDEVDFIVRARRKEKDNGTD